MTETVSRSDTGRSRLNKYGTWTVALAVLPVIVATARAMLDGWVPIGDNAYFAIRARDVFSSHIPLLGTWTSASLTLGTDLNNPGPLLFDLYAVPTTVFGANAGLAIGAAGVNIAAILGIGWVAHRRGGGLLVAAAMLVTTALCWSMGSELLFDPWQPHTLVLPFLCFCFLSWALACGDLPALPWAIGVASLLVQTHITFAFLVPVLGIWGVFGLILSLRRSRREAGTPRATVRRRVLLTASVAVMVGVTCWLQPLVEQISRDQNLSHLAGTAGTSPGEVVGLAGSLQLTAQIVSVPVFFLRPSFAHAFESATSGPGGSPENLGLTSLLPLGIAIASLTIWIAALTLFGWFAARTSNRAAALATATALVGLFVGILTAARIPTELFGTVAAHQIRWLWPLSAFAVFAMLAVGLGEVLRRWPSRSDATLVALAALVALIAGLTLPSYNSEAGPAATPWAIPVVDDISHQLESLKGDGPFLDDPSSIAFAEPYSTPILAALQHHGVPFVLDNESLIRQLGPGRRFDGDNASERIFYRLGDGALETPAGARRVAVHRGLSQKEQRERLRLGDQLETFVANGRLRLSAEGRRLVAAGELPALVGSPPGVATDNVAGPGALIAALDLGALALSERWTHRLERYRELNDRWRLETISVFVAPIDDAARHAAGATVP